MAVGNKLPFRVSFHALHVRPTKYHSGSKWRQRFLIFEGFTPLRLPALGSPCPNIPAEFCRIGLGSERLVPMIDFFGLPHRRRARHFAEPPLQRPHSFNRASRRIAHPARTRSSADCRPRPKGSSNACIVLPRKKQSPRHGAWIRSLESSQPLPSGKRSKLRAQVITAEICPPLSTEPEHVLKTTEIRGMSTNTGSVAEGARGSDGLYEDFSG